MISLLTTLAVTVSDLGNEENFQSTRRRSLTRQRRVYMTWTLPENPSNLLIQGTVGCATKNLDVVSGFRSLSQQLVLYVDEVTPRGSETAPSDEKQTQHATKTKSERRLHVRLSAHPRIYAHFDVCLGGDELRALFC